MTIVYMLVDGDNSRNQENKHGISYFKKIRGTFDKHNFHDFLTNQKIATDVKQHKKFTATKTVFTINVLKITILTVGLHSIAIQVVFSDQDRRWNHKSDGMQVGSRSFM